MTSHKTADTKNLTKRFYGFWLLAIAAVSGLLIPEPSPFITVVTWIVIICGITVCLLEQQWELEERARRRHDD
jgi:uncharacterized membrane protein YccC